MDLSYEDIAKMIDHSLLNPTLTPEDLENGCRLAAVFNVASVCIVPFGVSGAASALSGTDVAVGTTVGFPHGVNALSTKLFETEQALKDGAVEIDMMLNLSLSLSGRFDEVGREVEAVGSMAHKSGAKIKVIFENCYQSPQGIIALCGVCGQAGADWVKTSTGYGEGGAENADLQLMRENSPEHVQIKAAGGIRTLDRLLEVRNLGCTRVGATRTASILNEARMKLGMKPFGSSDFLS